MCTKSISTRIFNLHLHNVGPPSAGQQLGKSTSVESSSTELSSPTVSEWAGAKDKGLISPTCMASIRKD